MFVDNDGVLQLNHRDPTGSGKIGAVGKGVNNSSSSSKRYEWKKDDFPSPQIGIPAHSRKWTWHATHPRETEMRDVQRVLHDLSGGLDKRLTARMFSVHSCIAHSQWQEFFSISASNFSSDAFHICQKNGHLHLVHISFVYKGHRLTTVVQQLAHHAEHQDRSAHVHRR